MMAKVEGLKEVLRELKKVPKKVRGKTLDSAVRAGSKKTVQAAQRLVPTGQKKPGRGVPNWSPGNLRRAIKARKDSALSTAEHSHFNIGYLRKQAYYGGFVELGTSTMPAKPYLRPALTQTEREATKEIAKVLRKKLGLRRGAFL